MSTNPEHLETDPRFPSGRWVGFWTQKLILPGRHPTELLLTFSQGILTGEGRDRVGKYTVRGRYDLTDGRCHWIKTYKGKHTVAYRGFNEGKGIWGTWLIAATVYETEARGGFHIWPENMANPTGSHLTEEADVQVEGEEEGVRVAEPAVM